MNKEEKDAMECAEAELLLLHWINDGNLVKARDCKLRLQRLRQKYDTIEEQDVSGTSPNM